MCHICISNRNGLINLCVGKLWKFAIKGLEDIHTSVTPGKQLFLLPLVTHVEWKYTKGL